MSELGLGLVDQVANDYLTEVFPKVSEMVSQPIEYLGVMYVAFCGYRALNGHLNVQDFLARIAMVALVFATISWGGFGGDVYKIFNGFLTNFAKGIFNADDADSMLTAFYGGVLAIGQSLLDKAGTFSPGLAIQAIALMVVDVILIAISYAILIFAKLGLAVTMSICPLFMGFMIFPATRQWAYNWISMMLNFTFIYVLTMAVIRFSFAAFESTFNNMEDIFNAGSGSAALQGYIENSADVYGLMLIMGIMIIFLLQVKSWAAALSGGAMIQGIGGTVGNAAMRIAAIASKNPAGLIKGRSK